MRIFNYKFVAVVVASSIALTACSSDNAEEVLEPTTQDVSINFAAQISGADFVCGQTYTGVGTLGSDFKVNDFRMYVHDVHIHDALTDEEYEIELTQDGIWQLDDVAMLDFEDASGGCTGTAEMNTVLNGKVTVPATIDLSAAEVCFEVGVPEDKNHINEATAASPLNASGMLWAWKVGRKYIRIDGVSDPLTANEKFNLHLGAQGCPGSVGSAPPDSACTVPNTFEVCIANFDVVNSVIAVDPAQVLEGNNITVNLDGGATAKPGCQSFIDDNDCEEILPRLGLDYAYGRVSGTASTYTGSQKMFSKQ